MVLVPRKLARKAAFLGGMLHRCRPPLPATDEVVAGEELKNTFERVLLVGNVKRACSPLFLQALS